MRVLPSITAGILLALTAPAFAAADVSGKWSGSMDMKSPDGNANSTPVYAELKQDGTAITGTAGATGHEALPLEKGTIAGDQITFEVRIPDGGAYSVRLTIAGSQMKGEVTFTGPGGGKQTAGITLTRN